jgi:hypothetical protein
MSEKHEDHIAEVFEGRKTPGSGNKAANPMDVRQSRYSQSVAFAVDGKSTRGKSISVTRPMLDKAVEQAHGERPAISLRFYDDDRLKGFEDWTLVREDDLVELMERSEKLAEAERAVVGSFLLRNLPWGQDE